MKLQCIICEEEKEDVTEYLVKSSIENHTYWKTYWCIDCRDTIYGLIDELAIKKREAKTLNQ